MFADIEVGGPLKNLRVAGNLTGNVTVLGDLGRAAIGANLGADGTTFEVGGLLKNLTVGSRTTPGDLLADLTVTGDLTKAAIYGDLHGGVTALANVKNFTAGLICNRITVAGDLGSLTTASVLQPGVDPVDFTFQNAGPEPDGQLIVGGVIGRARTI